MIFSSFVLLASHWSHNVIPYPVFSLWRKINRKRENDIYLSQLNYVGENSSMTRRDTRKSQLTLSDNDRCKREQLVSLASNESSVYYMYACVYDACVCCKNAK